jgi:hypothetical protein
VQTPGEVAAEEIVESIVELTEPMLRTRTRVE